MQKVQALKSHRRGERNELATWASTFLYPRTLLRQLWAPGVLMTGSWTPCPEPVQRLMSGA